MPGFAPTPKKGQFMSDPKNSRSGTSPKPHRGLHRRQPRRSSLLTYRAVGVGLSLSAFGVAVGIAAVAGTPHQSSAVRLASVGSTVTKTTTTRPVLKPDGVPVLRPDGVPVLKPDGKPVLKPDGVPVLKPDGVPVLKPDGKPVLRPDGKPVLRPDGKPMTAPDGTVR